MDVGIDPVTVRYWCGGEFLYSTEVRLVIPDQHGWPRPIPVVERLPETTPNKDGTKFRTGESVLAYYPEHGDGAGWYRAFYVGSDHKNKSIISYGWRLECGWDYRDEDWHGQPTHWLPMPPHPE